MGLDTGWAWEAKQRLAHLHAKLPSTNSNNLKAAELSNSPEFFSSPTLEDLEKAVQKYPSKVLERCSTPAVVVKPAAATQMNQAAIRFFFINGHVYLAGLSKGFLTVQPAFGVART